MKITETTSFLCKSSLLTSLYPGIYKDGGNSADKCKNSLTLFHLPRHENMTPCRCVYVRGRFFSETRKGVELLGLREATKKYPPFFTTRVKNEKFCWPPHPPTLISLQFMQDFDLKNGRFWWIWRVVEWGVWSN